MRAEEWLYRFGGFFGVIVRNVGEEMVDNMALTNAMGELIEREIVPIHRR